MLTYVSLLGILISVTSTGNKKLIKNNKKILTYLKRCDKLIKSLLKRMKNCSLKTEQTKRQQ